jgi:3-methyladenine DNA glycosylase/8-oxoguanine DNA glycosylase
MIFDTRQNANGGAMLEQAARELCRSDPTLALLIAQIGPCQLRTTPRGHYFRALAEAIVYQQLSGKAAATILARFRALYPSGRFPTPEQIISTPQSRLRAAGLSRQKISYLKDLSARVVDKSFPLQRLAILQDEKVIEHLTQVKGIGRWTAEMFLMFCLARMDVLPLQDLGIRKAAQKVYGFRRLPSARTLERLGRAWTPFRSVACWYLWASVDTTF